MNVPLKKRYNYCGINGNASSINAMAKKLPAANYSFNDTEHQPAYIEVGKFSSKTLDTAICTLSTTILPSTVKGVQSVRIPQQYAQYKGDIINPIHLMSRQTGIDLATKPVTSSATVISSHLKSSGAVMAPIPHLNPVHTSLSASSSSSVIMTSSASNHSFVLSERNDERSSSQCSRKLTGFDSQKNNGSLPPSNSGRYMNKLLTESSVKLIELRNPSMTTQDRVMNWKIADSFSDVEDDFDDTLYSTVPFRSERLQKRCCKKPLKIAPITNRKWENANMISVAALPKKTMAISGNSNTLDSESSSDAGGIIQREPFSQKILTRRLLSRTSSLCRKRKLLPPKPLVRIDLSDRMALKDKMPSAIKLRIDYSKKTPQPMHQKVQPENFKVPNIPVGKSLNEMKVLQRNDVENKIPLSTEYYVCENRAQNVHEIDDSKSTTSSNEMAEIGNTKSSREEFYKYLGIDTNPNHDKHSPESSAGDTTSTTYRRRSLRVKIHQKYVESITKSNNTTQKAINQTSSDESGTKALKTKILKFRPKNCINASSPISSTKSNNESKAPNIINNMNFYTSLSNEQETDASESTKCSKLLKISYVQNEQKKVPVSKSYKSICLVSEHEKKQKPIEFTPSVELNTSMSASMISGKIDPASHIVDRRTYKSKVPRLTDSKNLTDKPKIVFGSHELSCKETRKCFLKTENTLKLDTFCENKETINETKEAQHEELDEMSSHSKTTIFETKNNDESGRYSKQNECPNQNQIATKVAKRKIFIRKAMTLTNMFKRYKQCLRQGITLRNHLQQHQLIRRKKRRPVQRPSDVQCKNETNLTVSSNEQESLKPIVSNDPTENAASIPFEVKDKQPDLNVQTKIINSNLLSTPTALIHNKSLVLRSQCEDLSTFSLTTITHSTASTDSAIVVSHGNEMCQQTTPRLQCHDEHSATINSRTTKNPLKPENGKVLSILSHSMPQTEREVIIVVQDSMISYWRPTPKILCVLGMPQSWDLIAEIKRTNNDTEIGTLYQHRLVNNRDEFPAYVELRARESPPNEIRHCCLTFVYVNVYFIRREENNEHYFEMKSIHLDTIKGFLSTINYIAIRNTSHVLMSWEEQTVNQTRCGIVKYNINTPEFDSLENILDFAYLKHDIKSLISINDNHVVGCGDRTVSLWDHRNGNLLMDFEIDISTMGKNLECYTIDYNSTKYMILVQLMVNQCNQNSNACTSQELQLIAVQTIDPYNWRILQTHNIPDNLGRILSTFISDDMLTITFTSRSIILLNISTPQTIYIRNESLPSNQGTSIDFKSTDVAFDSCQTRKVNDESAQIFTQSNGRVIHISSDRIMTRTVWEYFFEK